jgi:hypothetical protein
MRIGFWRGIITGGILGAIISMLMGSRGKNEEKEIFNNAVDRTGSGARRVLRGITRGKW